MSIKAGRAVELPPTSFARVQFLFRVRVQMTGHGERREQHATYLTDLFLVRRDE